MQDISKSVYLFSSYSLHLIRRGLDCGRDTNSVPERHQFRVLLSFYPSNESGDSSSAGGMRRSIWSSNDQSEACCDNGTLQPT